MQMHIDLQCSLEGIVFNYNAVAIPPGRASISYLRVYVFTHKRAFRYRTVLILPEGFWRLYGFVFAIGLC